MPKYSRTVPGGLHTDRSPLDQRLALRFSPLATLIRKWAQSRPVGSRTRRFAVTRMARLAFSNYERGEFKESVELFYRPDAILESGDMVEMIPGIPRVSNGRAEITRWLELWHEVFAWVRYETPEMLDFGDWLVFTLRQENEGRASGARTEITSYSAIRLEDGQVAWQKFWRGAGGREKALRAAGVEPDSIR